MQLPSTAATSGPTARPMAAKGATAQAIGPSRGGQTTKIHALTNVLGRPGVLLLTPGNAGDVTTAPTVLAEAPGRIQRLAVDKGYDADWLRADPRKSGIMPIIPGKRGRKRKIRQTGHAIGSAGGSRRTSTASKTSAALPLATTNSPATTPRPSLWPPSSPSGADRVHTITRTGKLLRRRGAPSSSSHLNPARENPCRPIRAAHANRNTLSEKSLPPTRHAPQKHSPL